MCYEVFREGPSTKYVGLYEKCGNGNNLLKCSEVVWINENG